MTERMHPVTILFFVDMQAAIHHGEPGETRTFSSIEDIRRAFSLTSIQDLEGDIRSSRVDDVVHACMSATSRPDIDRTLIVAEDMERLTSAHYSVEYDMVCAMDRIHG